MSEASTSPSLFTESSRVCGSRVCALNRIFLRFKTMSVTSSTTPSIVANSCIAPLIFAVRGIKFSDALLIANRLYLIARRNAHPDALQILFVQRKPSRHCAAGGDFQVLRRQLAARVGILDFDDVIHTQAVRRHVNF